MYPDEDLLVAAAVSWQVPTTDAIWLPLIGRETLVGFGLAYDGIV